MDLFNPLARSSSCFDGRALALLDVADLEKIDRRDQLCSSRLSSIMSGVRVLHRRRQEQHLRFPLCLSHPIFPPRACILPFCARCAELPWPPRVSPRVCTRPSFAPQHRPICGSSRRGTQNQRNGSNARGANHSRSVGIATAIAGIAIAFAGAVLATTSTSLAE